MFSGASAGANSSRNVFDFGDDDVLCSYDDIGSQDYSKGKIMDSSPSSSHAKGIRLEKSLMGLQTPRDESVFQDVMSAVERTMKKYADTLLHFLEGMSERLSQLEVYCSNLEKSVGGLQSNLLHGQSTSDQKFSYLEKHLQEVLRSVQILRDKQELADTQMELAKLQFEHKESATTHHSAQNEDTVSPPTSEPKKVGSSAEPQQQLALALPFQSTGVAQNQPSVPLPQHTVPFQIPSKACQSHQIPSQTQSPHLQPDVPYATQRCQVQDHHEQAPSQQSQHQPNQMLRHSYHSYQQWGRPVMPPQPVPSTHVRTQAPLVYPTYLTPPSNSTPETLPSNITMPVPQQDLIYPETTGYGYGGGNRMMQPQMHQKIARQFHSLPPASQGHFGARLNEPSYLGAGSQPPQPSYMYMMYEAEGGGTSQPLQFPRGSYPEQLPSGGVDIGGGQRSGVPLMPSHPHMELMEKAVNMGYARDHVITALHGMDESSQPLDFNALLDNLNGMPQRGW